MYKPFNNNFKTFTNNILSRWFRKSHKNNGHLNILKYAFITSVYWAIQRQDEISKTTETDYQNLIQPTLFF